MMVGLLKDCLPGKLALWVENAVAPNGRDEGNESGLLTSRTKDWTKASSVLSV